MAHRLRKDFLLFASNDPLTIDIDNDSDAIGLDSDMQLLEDVVRETNVSLYYGVTKQTLSSITAKVYADASLQNEITSCTCTCDVSTGNVKVLIPKGQYANSLYVNVTASCSFGTRSTLFTIFTQAGGEAGVTPVIYQLAPSVTSLPFPRSADGTIPDKTYNVQLQLKRTIGNHSEIVSKNDGTTMVVYYGYDHTGEMRSTPIGSTLSVTNANIGDHNSVDLELWSASKEAEGAHCIDRESLPITRDGKIGTDACRLDLDNENDSMLYSASGTLVSGNVTSKARLYFGTTLVTEGVEYLGEVHGCRATIVPNDDGSANVTVYELSELDAYVVVSAVYRGHTYDARLTVKKLVGVDKYDLVVSPSAIAVNDTKHVASASWLEFQVYRTEQNGTRTLLQTLPEGFQLYVQWSHVGVQHSYPHYENGLAALDLEQGTESYFVTLFDASGNVLDAETVPVNHCTDGDNPDVWTIGPDGYWYVNGEKTTTKATGAAGQHSFVSYMFCRSAERPDSFLTTQGSFGNPTPTHSLWKDAIPTGKDPVWMQSRLFTDDGMEPQQFRWSAPTLLADTSDVDICYHDAVEGGATPDAPLHHLLEDQGNGWRNTSTDSTEWMAVSKKTGGEWSPWAITKIKGETGAKGDDSFVLDIDNEMTSFPVDEHGEAFKNLSVSFGLNAFYGTRDITSECTITCETTGTSYGIDLTNPSEPIVSLHQGAIPEEITDITFKAHHPTYGDRYAVFSVAVVKAGGRGSDAVLNELLPSLNQVSFARDADGKTLTPAQRRIELKIKRTRGESVSILDLSAASGITVRYSTTAMPTSKSMGTAFPNSGLPIDSNTTYQNVYIAAFNTSGTPVLPIDRETIPIIKDGSNGDSGTSPFLLDIDNEMTSIPLDENGYVSSAQTISFGMEAYYGIDRVLSDCEVELENAAFLPAGMTCDLSTPSSPVISITTDCTPAELTELTFKATHPDYGVRRAVFSIAAVKSGGHGDDAVLDELLPSRSQIVFQRNENDELTPDNVTVSVSVKRTKGQQVSNKSLAESGLTLRYSTAGMPATSAQGNPSAGTVTVSKSTTGTNLYLAAFNSAGTLVDRETIPIVRDGRKGDKGSDAININISTLNILAHKSTSAQQFYVSINVKEGDTPLPYVNAEHTADGFLCSSLADTSTVQGLSWTFDTPDANTFRYRLGLRANTEINVTIPFTVTVRGIEYHYELAFTTVDDGEPGGKGDKGDDGNGIAEVNYYRMTTMTFEAPIVADGGWIATSNANCPKETDLNKEKRYLWQRKTTIYTDTPATHEVSLLAQYNSGVCANLLEQTAFLSDGDMDKWNKAAGRVLENAICAQNGYLYTPVRAAQYVDVLQQLLYKHGEVQKLKPNTWYTLSFYGAMTEAEKIISATTWNGDGNTDYFTIPKGYSHAYLNPGQKMILKMTGYVADASKAFIRLYVWGIASNGTDWERTKSVNLKSQSSTTVTLEFTNEDSVGRMYYFRPYVYAIKNGSEVSNIAANNPDCANASYRGYIQSLTLDMGAKLDTYIYPNIGGDGVQHSASAPWYVDGKRFVAAGMLSDAGASSLHNGTYVSFAADGHIKWQLEPGSKRHTFTFKTPSSMSTSALYHVLFRWFADSHHGWISMPKIEENTMATEWMEHSNDRMADDMQHIYVGEWKPSVEGNAATNYLYALGVRHCVRAKSSISGDMTYFRMKKRTPSTGYCSLTQPYADTTMWERADYLRFVAADLLLAEEVITDKLTVRTVEGKNGNFILDKDGNVITKGTIYANAMYITPGAIKTVNGKNVIDLVENPGNTFVLPRNTNVYLPEATPFENITITILFGENSGLSCEDGIYTPYYVQSSFNAVPNNVGLSTQCLFSDHYMNSITLQAARPLGEGTDVEWTVVGQRGALQLRSTYAGGKLYDLMPDGRLVGLPF